MVGELAALGHVVAGCGRSEAGVRQLRAHYPPPHHFSIVDVGDDGRVERWAGEVLKTVGVPRLLINNAGVMLQSAPLWEIPAKDFDGLLSVNVNGVANVIRHFVPAMVAAGRGVIVNKLEHRLHVKFVISGLSQVRQMTVVVL